MFLKMHQQVDILVKGCPIRAEIRCDFGNAVRFQFWDKSNTLLSSGYKNQFIGIDEYPDKRIVERGVSEVLAMAKWLFGETPAVVKRYPVVTEPTDLANFSKWREFLKNPEKYEKTHLRFGVPVEPVQLTLF